MDCLKAQTRITSYVEGQLEGDELKEFLIHMEKCAGCKEELEIYYTLLVGTKQLDEGTITTFNFNKELDEKIHHQLKEIRHKERILQRMHLAVWATCIFLLTWTAVVVADLPVPFLNPPEISWEQQKEFIEKNAMPYMFHTIHESNWKGL